MNKMLIKHTWMRKKNIRSYKEFGRVVADYQKFPEIVLKKIKKEMEE